MKIFCRHKIFTALLIGCCLSVSAQQRLMMNGGFIKIGSGTTIVVDNAATNAITRTSGHIISEGENNILKWNAGTTTGTYTIPWGYGTTDYIPVTFTKSAGSGNGSFSLSTYHTEWKNSNNLPSGVTNVAEYGYDMSAFVLDRFWGIDATGYTTKPTISNLSLTYLNGEVTEGSNTLSEGELTAQRWNPNINDWVDFSTGVSVDTVNNKLTIPTVSGSNLYRWWVIVSSAHTLPVEIVSFTGTCDNDRRTFNWATASEFNNDHFTLERSSDGLQWNTVATINGAGNSNRPLNYSANDENTTEAENYYRLKQTDRSGASHYTSVVRVSCDTKDENLPELSIYPNPSDGNFTVKNIPKGATLNVYNMDGQSVYGEKSPGMEYDVHMNGFYPGTYLLIIGSDKKSKAQKIMIQN